jgi:16S rRNA (guanine527-N7)-methyltransferase
VSVSRETSQRLVAFEALVTKWNPTINLVSKASVGDLRKRHIADSEQLFDLAGLRNGRWTDLGSGGGFPGIVVAILGAEKAPGLQVSCIESDQRKAAFLATAAHQLGLNVTVLAERIEEAAPQSADVVSARALASLRDLLPLALRHLRPGGVALFPKGAGHAKEVDEARVGWQFWLESFPSMTDPDARILKLGEIRRD